MSKTHCTTAEEVPALLPLIWFIHSQFYLQLIHSMFVKIVNIAVILASLRCNVKLICIGVLDSPHLFLHFQKMLVLCLNLNPTNQFITQEMST